MDVYGRQGLVKGDSLKGVSMVEAEKVFIQSLGDSVRMLAAMKLKDGMRAREQADIAGSLQVWMLCTS